MKVMSLAHHLHKLQVFLYKLDMTLSLADCCCTVGVQHPYSPTKDFIFRKHVTSYDDMGTDCSTQKCCQRYEWLSAIDIMLINICSR